MVGVGEISLSRLTIVTVLSDGHVYVSERVIHCMIPLCTSFRLANHYLNTSIMNPNSRHGTNSLGSCMHACYMREETKGDML